jgi:hypothetical protein
MVFGIAPIFIEVSGHGETVVSIGVFGCFVEHVAIDFAGFIDAVLSECILGIADHACMSFDVCEFIVCGLGDGGDVSGAVFGGGRGLILIGVVCGVCGVFRLLFCEFAIFGLWAEAGKPFGFPAGIAASEDDEQQQRQNLPIFEHWEGSWPASAAG